jgi:hypothetical protein
LFSPHGIDIVQREDGKYQVLVVNHGGRESVELFDLMPNVVNNPQTAYSGEAEHSFRSEREHQIVPALG